MRYSELRPMLRRLGLLPTVPAVFDRSHAAQWLMLGNGPDDTVFPGFQGCGDCAWAGPAEEERESAALAGRPIPAFSGKTVVAQYSAYSGYNPQTGENDNGSVIADVIKYRQQDGLYDDAGTRYKIGQACDIEAGDLQSAFEAAYLFENIGIGIQVPVSMMRDFAHHGPIDYHPNASQIEGGHYIPGISRVKNGNLVIVTWATSVEVTPAFYSHFNDETVAYLDMLRYNAVTGETAEHYTQQDLERYFTAIAKAKGVYVRPVVI